MEHWWNPGGMRPEWLIVLAPVITFLTTGSAS
ncbi:hypothetical protein E143388_04785 [Rhodococcus opacus]|nr:hypothetical protein E143388_04785 [Rhodococcus opacus]